ncbi:class B sortase [Streptococcus sp. zg-JUN1979]|uniref:class B sortase n=1 Tax=Streptococcus sp. zg-JUN1979 TaxID=3391450 RepID=UPI0039A553DD
MSASALQKADLLSVSDRSGFSELKRINSELVGWLSIYGTQIDYPLVQTTDNQKYLSMDATGRASSTGAVFLDYRSQANFEDFNTIIYGHHVPTGEVFGQIKSFCDETFFKEHAYGSLYYNGVEKGLEIFAILEVDAYDEAIYQINVDKSKRSSYYSYLLSKAVQKRPISLSAEDHIVLMSTCYTEVTNGRHILLAKITDTPQKDTFEKARNPSKTKDSSSALSNFYQRLRHIKSIDRWIQKLEQVPLWLLWVISLVLGLMLIVLIGLVLYLRRQLRRIDV